MPDTVFTGSGALNTEEQFADVQLRPASGVNQAGDLSNSVKIDVQAAMLNKKLGSFVDAETSAAGEDSWSVDTITISLDDILAPTDANGNALAALDASKIAGPSSADMPADLKNAYSGFRTQVANSLNAAAEQLFSEEDMNAADVDAAEVLARIQAASDNNVAQDAALTLNNVNSVLRNALDIALNGRHSVDNGSGVGMESGFLNNDILFFSSGFVLKMMVDFVAETNTPQQLSQISHEKTATVDLALMVKA